MTADEPPFDPDYDQPGSNGVPPNDPDAERAVLACLLTDPTLAPTLTAQLDGSDFYRPAHEEVWDAIHALAGGDTIPDPVLVNNHLIETGHVDVARILPDIITTPANTALAEHYARIVRDHARLRAADAAATRIRELVRRGKTGLVDHYLTEALDVLEQTVTRYAPSDTTPRSGLVDLSWVLTGTPPTQPPPVYGRRTDGTALFYAGKVNGIFGDPEHGKTWVAQAAGVEALNAGGTFAMIDVDHNGPDHTAARLLLLGARLEHLADPERFRYYEPHEADELLAAAADITTRAPDVVIIDSLGEIFPMLGVKTNDGDEITTAMRQVCTRPATAGSCVITIDHLPKSAEARATGFAIGSIAKKRMMRGSYLRADARVKPAPGQVGRITLRIEKDTSGELRKTSGGGYAGTFVLDSTQPHVTTWSIGRDEVPKNDDGTFRPTTLMERVSRFIEDNDQCTARDIREAINGKQEWIRDALTILVREGFVARIDGPRRAKLHHSIAPYRETEDDHVETPE